MHAAAHTLGWDESLATAFAPFVDTHSAARVARVDRGAVDALLLRDAPLPDDDGAVRATVGVGVTPTVGDWVALRCDGDRWTVDSMLPRRSVLERAVASGRSEAQVIAANVDVVLIALPVRPEPKAGLVERMVALAWDSRATPVVVLTKADLTDEAAAIAADVADATPGVDVVTVSAWYDDGLAGLAPYLEPGRTLCLLGRSGAGKSTIVNTLLGEDRLATAAIRDDGKGRHTTTHRELVVLPSGAVLLDTPGLRGVGMWVTGDGLDRTFGDIDDLVRDCRFNDCGHVGEPGCAVIQAVDEGRLPQRRLDSWHKLRREAEWMSARGDARLQAERRRGWVIMTKEMRRSGRIRP